MSGTSTTTATPTSSRSTSAICGARWTRRSADGQSKRCAEAATGCVRTADDGDVDGYGAVAWLGSRATDGYRVAAHRVDAVRRGDRARARRTAQLDARRGQHREGAGDGDR